MKFPICVVHNRTEKMFYVGVCKFLLYIRGEICVGYAISFLYIKGEILLGVMQNFYIIGENTVA